MHTRGQLRAAGLAALLAVVAMAPAFAAHPDFAHTTLTGDWGGARPRLHAAGIDLNLDYFGDGAANFSGGDRRTSAYASALDFTGSVDFGKLAGWHGGSLHAEVVRFTGTLLDDKADLGSFLGTQQAFVPGDATWITNFYLEQALARGVIDLKYGRMDTPAAFFPAPCLFQGLSFCGSYPGLLVGDLVSWPTSAMAGVVTIHPSPRWSFELGRYVVQPGDLVAGNHRLLNRGHRVGTVTIGEVDLATSLVAGAATLPGQFALGIWHDSAPHPDLLLDVNHAALADTGAAPLMRTGTNGYYANLRQQITGTTADGITLFADFTHADPDVAFLAQALRIGLIDSAPLPGRPGDAIQVAIGRNQASGRAARARRVSDRLEPGAAPVPGSEYLAELDYVAQLHAGVSLMPNLQYTRDPGGISANRSYLVFGAQLVISL